MLGRYSPSLYPHPRLCCLNQKLWSLLFWGKWSSIIKREEKEVKLFQASRDFDLSGEKAGGTWSRCGIHTRLISTSVLVLTFIIGSSHCHEPVTRDEELQPSPAAAGLPVKQIVGTDGLSLNNTGLEYVGLLC